MFSKTSDFPNDTFITFVSITHQVSVSNIVWFQKLCIPPSHRRDFSFDPPPPHHPSGNSSQASYIYLNFCLWEPPSPPGIFNPLPYNYNSFISDATFVKVSIIPKKWASLLTNSTSDYCQSITSTSALIFVNRCISFASHLYQKIWMKHRNFQRSCWVLECPYQIIRSITI